MSNEQKIADVLSRMKCLSEDMQDAKTKQQRAMWSIDAKVAMDAAFELINEQLVEIHRLKAFKGLAEEARDAYAADKKSLAFALNDARAEAETLRKSFALHATSPLTFAGFTVVRDRAIPTDMMVVGDRVFKLLKGDRP